MEASSGGRETGESSVARAVVPSAAAWLGGAGLLPFAGLPVALLLADPDQDVRVAAALGDYGALILSFLGGCRWGFAAAGLGEGPRAESLALAVVWSLYAWITLLVGVGLDGSPIRGLRVELTLLALGFVALLASDVALTRRSGAPAWWARLRWPLTIGAVAGLLAGAAAAG